MRRRWLAEVVLPVEGAGEPEGFRAFVEARSSALLRSGWLLTGDWTSAVARVADALSIFGSAA